MEEEIVLKIKKSTVLDIVNLILKIYTVFLFFLALIIQSSETIIQTGIMIVVIVIFDFINDGEIILSNKGINVSSLGFTNWRNIERFDINKHIVSVKVKDERTKKVQISLRESNINIKNASRLADAKLELNSIRNNAFDFDDSFKKPL